MLCSTVVSAIWFANYGKLFIVCAFLREKQSLYLCRPKWKRITHTWLFKSHNPPGLANKNAKPTLVLDSSSSLAQRCSQGLLQQQLLASLAISRAAALLCQLGDPHRSRYRSRAEAVLLRCGFHLEIHPAHCTARSLPETNGSSTRTLPPLRLYTSVRCQLNPARVNQIPIFTCTAKQALSVSRRLQSM